MKKSLSAVITALGLAFVASACSSAQPTTSVSLPEHTSDPSGAPPGYYDTVIVHVDANNAVHRVYQHTTPEHYAAEVASHTGHPLPTTNTQPNQVNGSGEQIGSASSAIITEDGDCADSSLWVYNYAEVDDGACVGPSGSNEIRLCYFNDSGTTDTEELNQSKFEYELCDPNCGFYYLYGNVYMYWPGNQAGSFGDLFGGVYAGLSDWSAGGGCTTPSAPSSLHYIQMQ